MGKMIKIEYKDEWIDIDIPNDATVIQYKTNDFPEIPVYPDPKEAIRKALDNPIGMPPIHELVKKGSKVTIAFDDPIKNPQPIKIIIPIVVNELIKAGVVKEDITLLCATGAHCKLRTFEMKSHLGPDLYNEFKIFGWRNDRLWNHDCSQGNVFLGETETGDVVEYNLAVKESDQLIYVGTVFPMPYGGYVGQGVVIGLASMETLKCLHSYDVYKAKPVLTGETDPEKNYFRKHKLEVHNHIEKAIGKKIFYVDAIMGPEARIVNVYAGHVPDLEKVEYPEADKYFMVNVEQADIVVVGLPYTGFYDTSDNPGMACNASSAPLRMWRGKPLLKETGAVIALGQCLGRISPRRPGDTKALDIYRQCFGGKEFYDFIDTFCKNEKLLYQYRYEYAYNPIHSIFMMANIDTLQSVARHRIIAGNVNPGLVREMGAIPARSFADAFDIALDRVGKTPHVLVLPNFNHDPKMIFNVL